MVHVNKADDRTYKLIKISTHFRDNAIERIERPCRCFGVLRRLVEHLLVQKFRMHIVHLHKIACSDKIDGVRLGDVSNRTAVRRHDPSFQVLFSGDMELVDENACPMIPQSDYF